MELIQLHFLNPLSLTQNQLYSEKEEMTCFSCLNPRTKDIRVDIDTARPTTDSSVHGSDTTGTGSISGILVNGKVNSPTKPGGGAMSFTFKELAEATRNFREVNLLGEGGFGRVYKGRLDSGQVISLSLCLFIFLQRTTLFF